MYVTIDVIVANAYSEYCYFHKAWNRGIIYNKLNLLESKKNAK